MHDTLLFNGQLLSKSRHFSKVSIPSEERMCTFVTSISISRPSIPDYQETQDPLKSQESHNWSQDHDESQLSKRAAHGRLYITTCPGPGMPAQYSYFLWSHCTGPSQRGFRITCGRLRALDASNRTIGDERLPLYQTVARLCPEFYYCENGHFHYPNGPSFASCIYGTPQTSEETESSVDSPEFRSSWSASSATESNLPSLSLGGSEADLESQTPPDSLPL